MSNPSKRKGTTFEVAVKDYLRAQGVDVRRNPPTGAKDEGDLDVPSWDAAIECKATQRIELAHTVDEAEIEAVRAGRRFGIAVIKRRLKGIEDAYVVMSLADFTVLMSGYE